MLNDEVTAEIIVSGVPSTSTNKHRYVPASELVILGNVNEAVVAPLIFSYTFEVVLNFCH